MLTLYTYYRADNIRHTLFNKKLKVKCALNNEELINRMWISVGYFRDISMTYMGYPVRIKKA